MYYLEARLRSTSRFSANMPTISFRSTHFVRNLKAFYSLLEKKRYYFFSAPPFFPAAALTTSSVALTSPPHTQEGPPLLFRFLYCRGFQVYIHLVLRRLVP